MSITLPTTSLEIMPLLLIAIIHLAAWHKIKTRPSYQELRYRFLCQHLITLKNKYIPANYIYKDYLWYPRGYSCPWVKVETGRWRGQNGRSCGHTPSTAHTTWADHGRGPPPLTCYAAGGYPRPEICNTEFPFEQKVSHPSSYVYLKKLQYME